MASEGEYQVMVLDEDEGGALVYSVAGIPAADSEDGALDNFRIWKKSCFIAREDIPHVVVRVVCGELV